MKPTRFLLRCLAALTAGAAILSPPAADAAGLLIADGGFGGVLEIQEHDVKVIINNGVAVTHVTQVFRNTEQRQVEALYTFPVPKGASVANFSMWINGKEMVGEVLEKKRAREIYNSYKQVRRDPGAFVIAKHAEGYRQASLETKGGSLAQDVVLACQLQRPKTGIDVLTSARAGEDGFFSVTLTAGEDAPGKDAGADYVFVLDVSGSMRDDGKLLLSKDAIGAFLNELGTEDRFEVMTFNIQPRLAFNTKRGADAQAKHDAIAFLAAAQANGGTVLNPALTTAYKYADPDRPLNVVILSDGLTEQSERRALLELIGARPRNAKVFCIGVGNDVNRPLLGQLAADSGGLASFLSSGDNFTRQAKAFRRKLMNPVATDLQMTVSGSGIEVLDMEPRQMPNLFHGSPVRVYGRYRGNGSAKLSLRGNLNGVEWKQSADLELPREDTSNPEIERMWAWHRIDALLKTSERSGTREQVIPDVVRLGEEFSIVTEYTSFLVLENDAELQRWKIERRNAARLARDRQSQSTREIALNALRQKAVADLGPQSASAETTPQAAQVPAAAPQPANAPIAQNPPSPPTRSQSRDLNVSNRSSGGGGGGSGPVGPLFVAFSALLARLKRRGQTARG